MPHSPKSNRDYPAAAGPRRRGIRRFATSDREDLEDYLGWRWIVLPGVTFGTTVNAPGWYFVATSSNGGRWRPRAHDLNGVVAWELDPTLTDEGARIALETEVWKRREEFARARQA